MRKEMKRTDYIRLQKDKADHRRTGQIREEQGRVEEVCLTLIHDATSDLMLSATLALSAVSCVFESLQGMASKQIIQNEKLTSSMN
jgi:hypothetical protein